VTAQPPDLPPGPLPEWARRHVERVREILGVLGARGVVTDLEDDERVAAVITPRRPPAQAAPLVAALDSLAQRWPVRVLGLETLRRGEPPEVYTGLLGLPIRYDDPASWIERVVVVVARADGPPGLHDALIELLSMHGGGGVETLDAFLELRR